MMRRSSNGCRRGQGREGPGRGWGFGLIVRISALGELLFSYITDIAIAWAGGHMHPPHTSQQQMDGQFGWNGGQQDSGWQSFQHMLPFRQWNDQLFSTPLGRSPLPSTLAPGQLPTSLSVETSTVSWSSATSLDNTHREVGIGWWAVKSYKI